MDEEVPQKTTFSTSDLKLYVYGSRQADQFWLPNDNSHSRKPFCLTDVQKFSFNNEDGDGQQQNNQSKGPIPNPLFNQTVYKVACGSIHSVVLTTDGRVFTFGCNDQGALGRKGIQCIPIQVNLQDPIDLIAAGDNHSLFANSVNGAIYFTGNYNYKRGEKMTNSLFQPTRIFASQINISNKNKKIQKLSCGANHSCVLINGKIFCRGQPQASTIGRRISKRHKVQNSLTFNGVNLSDVVDIQCGGYHTIARVEKHKKILYYAWGTNDHGQLGIGSFDSQAYPTQIKKLRQKDIKQIAAGATFTLFLDADGELYGCGNNEDSNLGLGQDFEYEQQQNQQSQIQQQHAGQAQKKSNQLAMQQQNKPTSLDVKTPQSNLQSQKNQQNKSNQMKSSESKQVANKLNQLKIDQSKQLQMKSQQKNQHKQEINKNTYIKTPIKIELPERIDKIATGDNSGFAWSKQNLYTWGMGMGYVLLNGQQQDQTEPFKVKSTIINSHSIYQLDAGNQHVLYTSYPKSIQDKVKIQPKPSVWQNLSIAKHGLKRRK